jgi:hypothetical protein
VCVIVCISASNSLQYISFTSHAETSFSSHPLYSSTGPLEVAHAQIAKVLALPLAHLVNMSYATGTVPDIFKNAKVHPVHKGGGKSRKEPSSYRPVSILPAMSKILEGLVKKDLERHLAAVNGLPQSQHGFPPGRSCTTALASAHVEWTSAAASGKVVGIMGYNLSSAFDTVAKESLLPKLEATGISGRQLDWFSSYISGGQQCVVWNVAISVWLPVENGVRQGSILGPILFLVIVADIPEFIGGPENSGRPGGLGRRKRRTGHGSTAVE